MKASDFLDEPTSASDFLDDEPVKASDFLDEPKADAKSGQFVSNLKGLLDVANSLLGVGKPPIDYGVMSGKVAPGNGEPPVMESQFANEFAKNSKRINQAPGTRIEPTSKNLVIPEDTGVLVDGLYKGLAAIKDIGAGATQGAADLFGSDMLADHAKGLSQRANNLRSATNFNGQPVEGFADHSILPELRDAISPAIASTIQTAPAMLTRRFNTGAMLGTSTASAYGDARIGENPLLEPEAALKGSVAKGGIEAYTEKMGGLNRLTNALHDMGGKHGATQLAAALTNSAALNVPTELLATAGNFAVDKNEAVGLHQDATMGDLADQLKDTAKVALVQSLGMGGAGHALNAITNKSAPIPPAPTPEAQPIDYNNVIDALTKAKDNTTQDNTTQDEVQPQQEEALTSAIENVSQIERRGTSDERRAERYATMTPEEMRVELADKDRRILTDHMTGVPNLIAYDEVIKEYADNNEAAPMHVFADIDNQKQINSEYGYEGGDAAIKAFARALHSVHKKTYRKGGDEFVLLVKDREEADNLMAQARAILDDATITYTPPGGEMRTKKGIGFSYGTGTDIKSADANGKADKAARAAQGLRFERDVADRMVEDNATGRETGNQVAGREVAAEVPAQKAKPKKSKKTHTLQTALKGMGGLRLDSKNDVAGNKFAPGGYNQIFKTDASNTIEGLVGKGELDEFLPYELRFATNDRPDGEVADMQEAAEWLKDRIRSGERVIPYDAQMELDQRNLSAQAIINVADQELSDDEINRELQEAADAEREASNNAKIFDSIDEDSNTQGSTGAESGEIDAGSYRQGTPALELTGQTNAEIVAQEQAAQDTAAEDKAAADRAAELPLTLSAQSQEKSDTPTVQAGMFTPDGRATVAAETKPQETIEDFGEKLEGAKKDLWKTYQKAMSDQLPTDPADITLAKNFPEPDYENLIASGVGIKALAVVKAMRDSIGSKPRKSYKVSRWVTELATLREFANNIITGKHDADNVIEQLKKLRSTDIAEAALLYEQLGYPAFTSAKGYRISSGWTELNENGTKKAQRIGLSDPNNRVSFYDSYDDAVNALRAKLEVKPEKTGRSVTLDRYRTTAGDFIIGKKVASNKYIDLKGGFKSFAEAREYQAEHEAELLELLANKKEVAPERRSTNNPRIGKDYRLGEEVTPEKFAAEFGFRGVQFGNYVEQVRRVRDLNNAYDALLDLANLIGIPSRAISLNGSLGLAFGARGSGGKNAAAAHYEAGEVVINLTKGNGAGSLGHEWFHAMDNYFGKSSGGSDGYLTNRRKLGSEAIGEVRPEVAQAFGDVMRTIRGSSYFVNAHNLDKRRSKDYWSTDIELAARAFEAYLIDKAAKNGESSDYLANIVSEEAHDISNDIAKEVGFDAEPYPYPRKVDMEKINPLFDKLFATLKTKETDKGIALFSKSSNTKGQTVEQVSRATAKLRNGWHGFHNIKIIQTVKEVPNEIYLRALRALKPIDQGSEGFYDPRTNTVYLIADNLSSPERAVWVAAHEVVGHGGIRVLDKSVAEQVDRMAKNGTVGKLAEAIAKDRGERYDHDEHTQEAIAELAAAHVTGDAGAIFDRYGVNVPMAMRDTLLGVIARIVEAVRSFMAKVLGHPVVSDKDVISLIEQMQSAVEGNEQEAESDSGYVLASKKISSALARVFNSLAAVDDTAIYGKSSKTDMQGIASDLDPKLKIEHVGISPEYYIDEDGVRTMRDKFDNWRLKTIDNKGAYITANLVTKELWINVGDLKEGASAGSLVYQLAGQYAANNGLTFIGDSDGISNTAMYRRTENMISLAIKYGTTEFMEPHPDQLKKYNGQRKGEDFYWPGMEWTKGDHEGNLHSLLMAAYDAVSHHVPEIKNVIYDTNTNSFRNTRTGQEFTDEDFEALANTGAARSSHAGSTTLKRAALANSVLSGALSEAEWSRSLVGIVADKMGGDTRRKSIDELRYSQSSNKPAVKPAKLPRNTDVVSRILPKSVPLLYSRDEKGNIRLDLTHRAKEFINAAFTRPMAVKMGMASATPELAKLIRRQKADIDKAMRVATEVIKSTEGMSEAESALISRIVTQEMTANDVPPEHALKIAAVVEQAMTQQGQEAVDLKMISPDAYEKWKGKYLPRFYMRHLDPEFKNVWQRTFKSKAVDGFRSGSLKGRGKRQVVTAADFPQWEALGWTLDEKGMKRSGNLRLELNGKPVPDTDTVAIWKDYTPDERKDMGEVEDFRLRFVMGYLSMQRDISVGRLYKRVAENTEWTRRTESEGFVYVPETEIPDTGGLKRYGSLSGMYVKKEILDHISQYEQNDNDFKRYYKAALSKWKEGKTVLNPVTHMNNFVSNVTNAHFAGVSYWDGEKYLLAIKDLAQNADMVKEAEDAGLFSGGFSHAEIMKGMPPEVRKLVNQVEDGAAMKVGRTIWQIASLGLNDKAAIAYQWGDSLFSYIIYRDARSKGMSPEDAVYHAGKYIFKYDDLPETARGIRDYAIPFFAYTYKAVPMLINTAVEYPWRFAAPATAVASLNALVYAGMAQDAGDDDWWLTAVANGTMNALLNAYTLGMYGEGEAKTAGQKLEQAERKNLPEWDQGASALGTQKTIRMGTDEKTGLPVFLNVYRFMPGGDIQDVTNEKGGLGIPAPLMPSNPLLNAYSALVDNRSWDGKELFDKNDTKKEAAVKTADFAYKLVFPAIAPGAAHYDRILNGAANYFDTTIETPLKDYTGIGKDGLPAQSKYAAMQTFGIKAKPVDLELSAQFAGMAENSKVKSIVAEVRRAARLRDKRAMSDREYDTLYDDGMKKIEAIQAEQ